MPRQEQESPTRWPTCTVAIPTRGRLEKLEECLRAVSRLDYPSFDVLVVGSAPSDDRTRERAARWSVRYERAPVPGAYRARNAGARLSNTEIVAYLDDDAVPERDWLSVLVREFADPRVMAVAGRINPLKLETEAERLCEAIGSILPGGGERLVVDRYTPEWFEITNFGGMGGGANMAFRRSAFEFWPGFDERLDHDTPIYGGGESYAFFALVDAGYRVVYAPDAVVAHPYPATFEELRRRYHRGQVSAGGYATLLFMEQPAHRRALLRYVLKRVLGRPRRWRGERPGRRARILPRWKVLLAWLTGPALYWRTRRLYPSGPRHNTSVRLARPTSG